MQTETRRKIEELADKEMQRELEEESSEIKKSKRLPEIIVSNRPLRDISDDALSALVQTNTPPHLFVRSGVPTRVTRNERLRPVLEPVGESALRGYLTRSADLFSHGPKKE